MSILYTKLYVDGNGLLGHYSMIDMNCAKSQKGDWYHLVLGFISSLCHISKSIKSRTLSQHFWDTQYKNIIFIFALIKKKLRTNPS